MVKALESLLAILLGTIKFVVALAAITIMFLVGYLFYNNVENSRNDWRNYDIQFDFEDGLSTSYTMPVDEIVESTIDDSVEFIDSIINR